MNIFILDRDLVKSAQAHVDKHIVKMPLETAQLLCTARRATGESPDSIPYRTTHMNHPCSVWARQSLANYTWLCKMGIELCKEYTYRYGKTHKCEAVIQDCIDNTPEFEHTEPTEHAQAMDVVYRMSDPVLAYRNYYNQAKAHLHSWKNRPVPVWIS
jgi:hypothetical protein